MIWRVDLGSFFVKADTIEEAILEAKKEIKEGTEVTIDIIEPMDDVDE
jgi:hypothetical protein